jgi:formate hydrogenlyase subunit 3/multisubunit Na+/H+ antiporter MnhD subunit
MVETCRKIAFVIAWLIVVTLPMLTGFAMVFFAFQHAGLAINFRPWLVALVILLVIIAVADARYRKWVAQREEARNV